MTSREETAVGSPTAMYRNTGMVLARASTDPGGLDLPDQLDGETAAASGREWLARVWHRTSAPCLTERLSITAI